MYPRCQQCSMQTNSTADGHKREQQFTAYGEELERVEAIKYLGRLPNHLLTYDGNDIQAVQKGTKFWARISRALRTENSSPQVCRRFYKATVQVVLLFGSETWNITPTATKSLEGFHMRTAWRMASDNKPYREPDGTRTHLLAEDALEEVGMHTITYFVEVRRQTRAKVFFVLENGVKSKPNKCVLRQMNM
ncbi:hypothetical protein ACHAXR_004714 [Thalassiosira sp. AJA248-18]